MKLSKLLSFALAIAMLFSVIPLAVFAEGSVTAEDAVVHYPNMEYPYVELYDEYAVGATYNWLEDGVSLGITDPTLGYYEILLFSTYTCEIALSDGSQFSVEFVAYPVIDGQPTNRNPYFVVSGAYSENVNITYQWYGRYTTDTVITDENASNECTTCENSVFSSYDAATNSWTGKRIGIDANGDKEYFAFEIALNEGDMLLIDAEPDVNNVLISDKDYDIITTAPYALMGNIRVYTAEQTDTYKVSVCTQSDEAVFSAYIRNHDEEATAIADETSVRLQNFEYGVYYYCTATYENGYTLKSNTVLNVPYVYTQPSATAPCFETSDNVNADFQWYEIINETTPITDENAVAFSDEVCGTATYNGEDGSWTGVETDPDRYDFLVIDLNAGDVIEFTADTALDSNSVCLQNVDNGSTYDALLQDGKYSITIDESGRYDVYVICYTSTVTVKAALTKEYIKKLEDENSYTLQNPELYGTYFCEARYPALSIIVSEDVTMLPEILTQPTLEDPTLLVSYDEVATYQWYSATEIGETVTPDDIYDIYGTYDSESGLWTPQYGDPYKYEYYEERSMYLHSIKLKKGEIIKVTILNPDAISPEDPSFRFYEIGYGEHHYELFDVNGNIYFTAPRDDIYELFQFGIYPEETQYKIEKLYFDLVELEGETEPTLKNAKRDQSYIAKAFYPEGFELESKALKMLPAIIKQPTSDDISVETNIIEDTMQYQWYTFGLETSDVTPDNAILTDSSNPATFNSETKEWTPTIYDQTEQDDGSIVYELDLFILALSEGDTVTLTPSEPLLKNQIIVMTSGPNIKFSPNEDGDYVLTATENDEYYFYFFHDNKDVTVKASTSTHTKQQKLDGENGAKLQKAGIGLYQCEITYDESTKLYTDKIWIAPAITKQPTADDPSVEVNVSDDGTKYQWYKYEKTESAVTDSMVANELIGDEMPSYDSENNKWSSNIIGESESSTYAHLFFVIELKAGSVISFEPDADIDSMFMVAEAWGGSGLEDFDVVDGKFVITIPEDDTYAFIVLTTIDTNIEFSSTVISYTLTDAVDGETESTLKTKKAGTYACKITFSDGTVLVSDKVELESQGDVNGDGVTNSSDYILVKRACFKTYELSEEEFARADINGSNNIDSSDYTLVKRIAFGTYQ